MESRVIPETIVALGFVAVVVILALRMPAEATGDAFNHMVGAVSDGLAIAENSSC